MEDLLDKLKALGLKVEKAVDLESPAVEETAAIDQVVRGRWLNELTHGVFVVEKDIPLGSKYGQIALFPPENMDYLKEFAGIQSDLAIEKMLFIDTETSSLSTGAGSFVFMVGISFFSGENLRIIQLFMAKPEFEVELLCYFDDILKDFDTFVSYNGKAFDIPMLRSRYIMNRLPVSFTDYQHLDLLHIARRIWKLRLDSRRLADIEKEILALTRSEEEIPGWLVPQIYFDYLDSHDAAPLKGVFYHNEMDVASLAALLIHINDILSQNNAHVQGDARDAYAIGSVFEKMGKWELSRDFLKSGMDQGLPDELKREAARSYANTLKKQDQWSEALEYWEFAAELDDYRSCIELAKFYEHRDKNIQFALKWVERAALLSIDPKYNPDDLKCRKARLEQKSEKENEG